MLLMVGDVQPRSSREEVEAFWESQAQYDWPLGLRCKKCGSETVVRAAAGRLAPFYCFNCTHLQEDQVERVVKDSEKGVVEGDSGVIS